MNKRITPTDMFLTLLAIMLMGVSFDQTWLGLQQIFGGSSMIIALVLSLLLLFLLLQLRAAKSKGAPTSGLVGIYFFIASFCFIANFNAIYTRFMRTDIFTTELRDIKNKFSELEINVESKLNYDVDDSKTRQKTRSELNRLKIQIIDEKNQGIGIEARQIIGRIEKLLGDKITPLTPISQTPSGYVDLANRMEEQIVEMMNNLSPEEKTLKNEISNASLKWDKEIQNLLLKNHQDIDDMAQGQIDKALSEYNKLGSKANSILGDEKFRFVPAYSKTQEVGKIGFAFNHAISNFGMFQIVVLLACILLDFGIMIIILLMPNENTGGNTNRSNSSVFTSKRSGKTLITNHN
jgi:hypothetical protein